MPHWIQGPEIIILVLLIVIVFGWKKLPDAARSLGRSMRIFKAEVEEMKDKPSPASRDTVTGQARREPSPSERVEEPRDGERYVTRPSEDHESRPPMA